MSHNQVEKTRSPKLSQTAKNLIAGSIAGVLQVFSGQPFDIVKVRMQSNPNPQGVVKTTTNILRNEGILAFYKGTTSPLAGIAFFVSVQFTTNEVMKRYFVGQNKKAEKENMFALTVPQYLLSGGASGLTSGTIACPVEHMRIRMQIQSGP